MYNHVQFYSIISLLMLSRLISLLMLSRLISVLMSEQVVNPGQMEASFQKIDIDGSGDVDITEFRQALKVLKVYCNEVQVSSMFRLFDSDMSGTVSAEEFVAETWNWKKKQLRALVVIAVKQTGGVDLGKKEDFCIKNEEFVSKTRNCVLKTRIVH